MMAEGEILGVIMVMFVVGSVPPDHTLSGRQMKNNSEKRFVINLKRGVFPNPHQSTCDSLLMDVVSPWMDFAIPKSISLSCP